MKKKLFLLLASFVFFCSIIVVIEVFTQIAHYITFGYFVFNEDSNTGSYDSQLFEMHPFLVRRLRKDVTVKHKGKTIKTTNYHTRWTGAPEDDSKLVRIAVVGGSTTFGTRVTDRDSWPAILQSKLGNQFSVINYGVPGYSTAEAIIQMALIVPEAKPHFVILFQGLNDIHNYHETGFGVDYYGHGIIQSGKLGIEQSKETFLDKLNHLSAIVRLIRKVSLRLFPETYQTFNTPDPFVDRIYVRNLKTLKLLSENIGAYVLFVPQLLNYSAYIGKEGANPWTRHIKNSAMPELMGRFNSLMQSVCSENDSKCSFLNCILMEQWVPDDFVDTAHFSKKGGEKFAEAITQYILHITKREDFFEHTVP